MRYALERTPLRAPHARAPARPKSPGARALRAYAPTTEISQKLERTLFLGRARAPDLQGRRGVCKILIV